MSRDQAPGMATIWVNRLAGAVSILFGVGLVWNR